MLFGEGRMIHDVDTGKKLGLPGHIFSNHDHVAEKIPLVYSFKVILSMYLVRILAEWILWSHLFDIN